jgi:hypothetical protein
LNGQSRVFVISGLAQQGLEQLIHAGREYLETSPSQHIHLKMKNKKIRGYKLVYPLTFIQTNSNRNAALTRGGSCLIS